MALEDAKHDCDFVETVSDELDPEFEPGEERALVRKIDLWLLPCIWLMYLLSYMDRTNIGNAKIAGMADDLKLTSNQYSVSLVVFFVSYVVFEVPSNLILSKTRPSIFLPIIMGLWGAITCCMAAIKSYEQLVALRFIVGILEAGFAPGILLIISSWYKKEEQSKRFAVYISAAVFSGAFGGLLAGGITKNLDGTHGLAGWRWLFIIEGVMTIGWSCIASFLLLDFPAQASKLKFSERERLLAMKRLRRGDATIEEAGANRTSSLKALVKAIQNWRTWVMVVGYMVIVGSSTLSYFYPTLVKGLGYTNPVTAQYMVIPIYAVAFVVVLINGIVFDKYNHYRGLAIAGWLTLACVCSVCVCAIYNFTARYVLLIIMASGLWASNGLGLSYASSTFGDMEQETRAVALALVNALGNLAQIYGAYLFPATDAPKYLLGFGVISGMLGLGVFTYIFAHFMIHKYQK